MLLSCGAGQEQSFQAFGERRSNQQNQSFAKDEINVPITLSVFRDKRIRVVATWLIAWQTAYSSVPIIGDWPEPS